MQRFKYWIYYNEGISAYKVLNQAQSSQAYLCKSQFCTVIVANCKQDFFVFCLSELSVGC